MTHTMSIYTQILKIATLRVLVGLVYGVIEEKY